MSYQNPYHARGNEPGWMLEIGTDRMTLVTDYGERTITTPLPSVQATADGRKYQARTEANELTVAISDQACVDSMSGKGYSDFVAIELNGQRLNGCGGVPR